MFVWRHHGRGGGGVMWLCAGILLVGVSGVMAGNGDGGDGATAGATASCDVALSVQRAPLLRHNYTLPWALRNSAISTIAPTAATRHLVAVLLAAARRRDKADGTGGTDDTRQYGGTEGEGTGPAPVPLRVAVVGGSFSLGKYTVSPAVMSWFKRLGDVLQASFPETPIVFHNGAVGGSRPYQACLCLETLLAEQLYDLVFVEYNPNLADAVHHPGAGPEAATNSLHFEMLLRKIMLMQNHPQIVLVQAMLPNHHWDMDLHFHSHSEEGLGMLAEYYWIPMVSMRNALWRLQRDEYPGFTVSDTRFDGHHFNDLGVTYLVDLMVHFFEELVRVVAVEECSKSAAWGVADVAPSPWSPSVVSSSSATFQRPFDESAVLWRMDAPHRFPPLNPGLELPTTWMCAPMEKHINNVSALVAARDLTVQIGNGWVLHPPDNAGRKYGFYTADKGADGSSIRFTWRPPREKWYRVDHRGKKLMFMVLYLISYTPVMGGARMSCGYGCKCQSVQVSAHWNKKQSISKVQGLEIEDPDNFSGACTIKLTATKGQKGGTKFQVRGIFVVEGNANFTSKGVWFTTG